MSRKPLGLVRLAVLTVGLMAGSVMPTLAASTSSAADVTAVEYDGGSYRQVGPGKWAEFDAAGTIGFEFAEISRDDSTVVLEDTGRGVSLTLDIASGVITFGAIGASQDVLYTITAATADPVAVDEAASAAPVAEAATGEPPAPATAETATVVSFAADNGATGQYVRLGSGEWAELDASGNAAFMLIETGRDASGIKLVDETRGLALTLDVANSIITWGAIGDVQEPLYSITQASTGMADATAPVAEEGVSAEAEAIAVAEAEAGPISPPAPGVEYRFIKLKHSGWYSGQFRVTWAETDGAGQIVANQFESGPQEAPYFHVVEFPPNASAISVVGEGAVDGSWAEAFNVVLAGPTNKCYVLSGTASVQAGRESDDPSNSVEDDCP